MIDVQTWYADRRMNLRNTLRWTVLAATLVAAGFASTSFLAGSAMPTLSCPTNFTTTLTFNEGNFPAVPTAGTPRYGTNGQPPHLAPTGGTILTNQFQSAGVLFSATSPSQAWTYLATQPDPSAATILSPSEGVLLSSIMLGTNPGSTSVTTIIRFVHPTDGSFVTARGSSIGLWAYGRGEGPLTFRSYDATDTLLETKTIPGGEGLQVFGTVQFATGDVARIEAVNTGLPQQGLAIDDLRYSLNLNCPAEQQSSSSAAAMTQCADSTDNDGDGLTDFPLDLGCHATTDTDEQNPTVDIKINGQNGVLNVTPGTQVTLSWTSTDAVRCDTGTSPAPWGPYATKATSGSEQVTVTQSMTFGMHCAETATSGMVAQDADVGVTVSTQTSSVTQGTCGDGIRQSNEICMALNICDPAPGFVCCPQDCAGSNSSSVSSAVANCADGIDNDGDGFVDGLRTAAVQRRPFSTADAVRDAINALGGARVPAPIRSMEFGCGSIAFGATSDAGFCAGLGYDGFEAAVCSYSACGAGGNPKVEANAYWSGPQVIRDDCNTWYQKNNTTWHNYLSSVTCLDNAACGDGKDNDFDGKIDMQDTGCANADDDSEEQHDTSCDSGTSEGAVQVNECADGIDNDGDGKIDRTQTSSLSTRLFTSPGEIAAAINALGSARVPTPLATMEFGCGSNGLGTASDGGFCGLLGYGSKTSNCLYSACGAGGEPKVTGNGYISGTQVLREDCNGWYLRARTTWHNYLHAAECVTGTPCSDGIDNDGDGLIDHPADIGCASQNDTSEMEADPECATGTRETAVATSSARSSGVPDVLTGIYARYTFDDGNVNDVSGNNRNGTPSGGPTFATKCLKLDGIDDRVALPNFDMPAFTASAWVKKENNGRAQWTPLIIGGDGHNGWGLGFAAGDSFYSIDGNVGPSRLMLTNMGWSNVRTKNDIPPGEFHHVAVTYDNTQGKGVVSFYIDGIPQAQSYPGGQPAFNNQGKPYGMGWISAPLGPVAYKGILDDVRVYNRVLSPGEIVSVSKQLPSCGTLAVPQCKDGIDNDKNGSIDFPADTGCTAADDFTESATTPDSNPPGLLSCLAGGEKGPTVVDFNATPGIPLTDQLTNFNGLLIEPLNGSTAIPDSPTEKEFKTIKRIVNVTAPGGAPKVALRFVNPETKANITVPGNTLRVLVGRKTAGNGAIIGRSYDYTGQQVEEWRSTSLQAYLSFSLWHVAKVELFAEDGGAFYFDNVGYGPLECTPFTEGYVRPSSSSRTSSSRTSSLSSARSSAPAPSSRASVKNSDSSVTSSLRSVMTSGRSSFKALSSLRTTSTAPSTASQPTSSAKRSSETAASAQKQSSHSSVRFSLPSINLPAGTSSLSNEQLRNILSLQFPEIPVDSFFPLPDGFWEGQENPDGVTLDLSQAVRAKSSSSAMSALALSWLDEWLPWRAAAPEETSSASSSSPVAASSEPEADAVASSMAATASADVESSAQSAPRWQSTSAALTPPPSDVQGMETTAPVTLSQDGMPLWWWIVLIVGAILGLLLGMYVTNRLLAPKEE